MVHVNTDRFPERIGHPADPGEYRPKFAGQFTTFETWVNKAQGWIGMGNAVCIDAKGRRCLRGADMMRARDEGAFPVRFFWECEPVNHPPSAE